tara:strand:- start:976 stop:1509 length:534 start_codon:yes stop_codon:yes gene_type:complete
MRQLDFFIKEDTTLVQDVLDIADIAIFFGESGQRRIDLNRTSDFLKSVPKEKYLLYFTGGMHPLPMYESRTDFPYIVNTHTGNTIMPNCSRAVYPCYTINNGKQGKRVYAHRIFGMAFVSNQLPKDNYNVDHINEDKLDYKIENLRWVSVSDNMKTVKNRASSKNKRFKFYSSENFV